MFAKLSSVIVSYRLPLLLLLNIALTISSYFLALGLRFEFNFSDTGSFSKIFLPVVYLVLFRTSCYTFLGLNKGYWRYASTHDALQIAKAHIISTILFTATVMSLRISGYPRSVVLIELCLSLLMAGGARLLVRLWCEKYLSDSSLVISQKKQQVIVLGAGNTGHLVTKQLLSHAAFRYEPVMVLDDSERLWGSSVYNVPIVGPLSDLEKQLETNPFVTGVIIAIPSLSKSRFSEMQSICKQMGIPLKKVQSFEDIACQDADEPRQSVTIESLLEKEVAIEHEDEIRNALHGKRILVTGGGGSIGSELVRQLLHFKPASLIVVDNSEYNLYSLQQEFVESPVDSKLSFVLADIRNQPRLLKVLSEHKPQYIFHAAAYKHVPLIEENCFEAFSNNVVGTRNLLEVAMNQGVEHFVSISTDKAVDPSSVMGSSKRIAEFLVQSVNTSSSGMTTALVRFGNVINSAGSVIPLFKKQILSGGPITVTHPEIERYFMSIREAVRLVLTAGTLGQRGEIFVLDMGKPIRIVDVARKMRSLYGRRDIPIVFTGLREGEKLSEVLTCYDENVRPSQLDKISTAVTTSPRNIDTWKWVAEVEDSIHALSDAQIGELLKSFVFDPENTSVENIISHPSHRFAKRRAETL